MVNLLEILVTLSGWTTWALDALQKKDRWVGVVGGNLCEKSIDQDVNYQMADVHDWWAETLCVKNSGGKNARNSENTWLLDSCSVVYVIALRGNVGA